MTSPENLAGAPPTTRRGRLWWKVVAGVLAVAVVAAVGVGAVVLTHHKKPFAPKVAIAAPVVAGTVQPNATIGFKTKSAKVRRVVVTTSTGAAVAGHFTSKGWTPNTALPLATKFHMVVKAAGGYPLRTVTRQLSFATPLPAGTIGIKVSPSRGQQVGWGATWVVEFSSPIPASMQSAVAQRLKTSESVPESVGWHWWSSTEVDGRPQQFWPLNEQASLSVNLDGLVLNGDQLENATASSSFTVVDQHLTKVSAITHQMQVYNGTQLINTFPVSLGKSGYPTISGTLVVLYKTPVIFMTAASNGWPDYYAQNVYQDVAISTDGYYMHSANWDVADHGVSNVSFGCIEQDPANATWFYNWSIPGDVVEVSGTPLQASETDGQGDWNTAWSQFQVVA